MNCVFFFSVMHMCESYLIINICFKMLNVGTILLILITNFFFFMITPGVLCLGCLGVVDMSKKIVVDSCFIFREGERDSCRENT